MKKMYFAIKRKLVRITCLFGKHNHKMGVPARDGSPFGCMWCRRPVMNKPMPNSMGTGPVLVKAERQVRRLFGGKA